MRWSVTKPIASVLCAVFMSGTICAQQSQPKYQQGGQSQKSGTTVATDKRSTRSAQAQSGKYSYSPQLTGADRDTIESCVRGQYGNHAIQVRPLPAALDKQILVGATLSPALQNRVRPFPDACSSRLLATLPANWTRALLGNHVVLLDANQKISDMFDLY